MIPKITMMFVMFCFVLVLFASSGPLYRAWKFSVAPAMHPAQIIEVPTDH